MAQAAKKTDNAMKRYNLTVPLDQEDYQRLRKLALAGMRKFTDQIRLLIREAYAREFEKHKDEVCHEERA